MAIDCTICTCMWKGPKRVHICVICHPLVIIESPYKGNRQWTTKENVVYARRALQDSLERGEAPMASHLLYTQVWDDEDPQFRDAGIEAGLAWGKVADCTAVYCDRGISEGMRRGIDRARFQGRAVIFRALECKSCNRAKPGDDSEARRQGWIRDTGIQDGESWQCSECAEADVDYPDGFPAPKV